MYTLDSVNSLLWEFSLFCEIFFLEEEIDFFLFLQMYAHLIQWFLCFMNFHEFFEIFFLEEKNWKKCVSSTKENCHFKETNFFKKKNTYLKKSLPWLDSKGMHTQL
jgi:hypothetical protein